MRHDAVQFFLFRKKLLPVLEHMHHKVLPDACVREDGDDKPAPRFAELIREAATRQLYGSDWYLHGNQSASAVMVPALQIVNRDNLSYLELVSYVEQLAHAYSWSLIPWGTWFTGQMLAFVAADERTFDRGIAWIIGAANRDLVVSSYAFRDIAEKQFRGAIFHRSTSHRGQGLWKHGRGSSDSALVLSYTSIENPGRLPPNCEVVCEASGYQFQPILRRWISVRDESALLHFVQNDTAVILTAAGLDERFMWLALQDFGDVAAHVNQDTLHFGLKALETVPWIYIPMSDDAKREIYVNNDPAVTTAFTQCDEVARSPYFAHQFFL